jgi:putative exporter of polyketide antibiotics
VQVKILRINFIYVSLLETITYSPLKWGVIRSLASQLSQIGQFARGNATAMVGIIYVT